jgi:hypothetical protein
MSNQITTAFVEQYSSNIQMLSQQKGSLLRDKVRLETVVGKNAFFDQVGSVTATVRTSRHSDTPQVDTPHSRRRVSLVDYEFADLIDDLAAGQIIAESGTGRFTIAKLRTAKQILDLADVDPSLPRYVVVGPKQITDLLGTTEVTSSDFNTVKALASGDVNSFLGFNFVVSNRLSVGSSIRDCIAFVNDGIALAVGKDVTARIDERADKGYATQVYYSAAFGATRMEEEKVVKIQAYEG